MFFAEGRGGNEGKLQQEEEEKVQQFFFRNFWQKLIIEFIYFECFPSWKGVEAPWVGICSVLFCQWAFCTLFGLAWMRGCPFSWKTWSGSLWDRFYSFGGSNFWRVWNPSWIESSFGRWFLCFAEPMSFSVCMSAKIPESLNQISFSDLDRLNHHSGVLGRFRTRIV